VKSQVEYELTELVDTYGEKLLRYATSILYNHQDAEDVVQDVFIAAYQNKAAFAGGNLSAWLYKITYNQSINKLKRRKLLVFADIPENTLVNTQQTELNDQMLNALKLLKPQDRAILYCRIIEGYSYEELSLQMGVSSTVLRKRYQRAKKKVADYLTAKNLDFDYLEKGAEA
jgi:RNA polymerase sigma-70 factor (ECF subfamily)